MSGITTGVGIFSGIDSAQLIEQLLAANSRPKLLAERRLFQLQSQQAAYLDLNSSLSALRSAAQTFRTQRTFNSKDAVSNNEVVFTASAGSNAQNGSYSFIVDKLVSTRQVLSRGFTDTDLSGIGLDSLSVEDYRARLDRETALADLNGGTGISRGVITINDVEVDLSKVATVKDVLDKINTTVGLDVTASVSGGSIVLTHDDPGEAVTVENGVGSEAATSLGIEGSATGVLTGSNVFGLNDNTALRALNDGRGVSINRTVGEYNPATTAIGDFTIDVGGERVTVSLGEIREFQVNDDGDDELVVIDGAVATIGGTIDRINEALATNENISDVTATYDAEAGAIVIENASGQNITIASINDTTTAEDLGIVATAAAGDITGARVLAGLNSTLASSINGGAGIGGSGDITFDLANGESFGVSGLDAAETLTDVVNLINADGRVTASLNAKGTGLKIVDNTRDASNTADLVISGVGGAGTNTAMSLGLEGTYTTGTATGSNLQLAWIGSGTRLADLNAGAGVGRGEFSITDSLGTTDTFDVDDDMSIQDLINDINDSGNLGVTASLNATGDGILITDTAGGTLEMEIEDRSGTAARELGIAGVASGAGADNFIDGSFEHEIEFEAGATLEDIVRTINEAGVQISASIINDGAGGTPYRLSIAGRDAGTAGRFILDTEGIDLGLKVLDQGNDARVFFGSSDPAQGILITSSSDTLDGVISGVSIDLKSTSADPVELSVSTDLETIEGSVEAFIEAYNAVLDRIDNATRYVEETNERGILLGDGTANSLKQRMFTAAIASNSGFSEAYDTLTSVGINVGEGGRLDFDRDDFRAALDDDPDAVRRLFTTRTIDPDGNTTTVSPGITASNPNGDTQFTALGVINQIEEFANDYVNSIDGVLTLRNESIDSQIALQQSRIELFDARLESQRQVLQRQFLAMEQSIAAVQTQSATLGSISLLG
ncbi:MAG: flagellar filament capping protein FliD [Phycisphaerales bacterium]